VANLSTTAALDEVARRFDCPVVRTKIGEANVTERMQSERAVIGGEGNGGVAVPRVLMSHDAAAAQGLIIEHMARSGASLRELVDGLPSFAMVKHDFAEKPSALYSVLQGFRDSIEREGVGADATDGIVVSFDDGWVHVRASQTESMIRVIAEAATHARARDLADWARDRLGARG
jgi:phosphomannomutase